MPKLISAWSLETSVDEHSLCCPFNVYRFFSPVGVKFSGISVGVEKGYVAFLCITFLRSPILLGLRIIRHFMPLILLFHCSIPALSRTTPRFEDPCACFIFPGCCRKIATPSHSISSFFPKLQLDSV